MHTPRHRTSTNLYVLGHSCNAGVLCVSLGSIGHCLLRSLSFHSPAASLTHIAVGNPLPETEQSADTASVQSADEIPPAIQLT